jgi:hypothetical protein
MILEYNCNKIKKMFILIKLNNILKFTISRSTMMATFHLC